MFKLFENKVDGIGLAVAIEQDGVSFDLGDFNGSRLAPIKASSSAATMVAPSSASVSFTKREYPLISGMKRIPFLDDPVNAVPAVISVVVCV